MFLFRAFEKTQPSVRKLKVKRFFTDFCLFQWRFFVHTFLVLLVRVRVEKNVL